MCAVADGLGGMDYGEVASGYIIEILSSWFYSDLINLLKRRGTLKAIWNSLYKIFYRAHNELKEYGLKNGIKTGTTLSLLLCVGNKSLVVNQGDTAIYEIDKKKRVRCLNPMIVKADSKLSNCIGLGSIKNIYMKKIRIRKNTSYLICSDGYYKMLDISNMAAALHSQNIASNDSINKILRTFGKKNEHMGEEDNMTAICLMF
jgi:serine/threonine protein phosphatase PrpC